MCVCTLGLRPVNLSEVDLVDRLDDVNTLWNLAHQGLLWRHGRLAVNHQERQVRFGKRVPGAFHALRFHRVGCVPDARRVGNMHRIPAQLKRLAQDIARGARNIGHDRAVTAGQRV